jgi:hypothetical protein
MLLQQAAVQATGKPWLGLELSAQVGRSGQATVACL